MDCTNIPISELSPPVGARRRLSVGLFTRRAHTLWAVAALLTVAPEVLPIPSMHLASFCAYYILKVICFLASGFAAPLAFQSLNAIGIGLFLSFACTFLIGICQEALHNGHVFHWYELAGKLSLIFLGFALALDCRYERKARLGPITIHLRLEHD